MIVGVLAAIVIWYAQYRMGQAEQKKKEEYAQFDMEAHDGG